MINMLIIYQCNQKFIFIKMRKILIITTSLSLCLFLTSCDGMRQSLGLDHNQVNPYSINECDIPLSVPEDYSKNLPEPGGDSLKVKNENKKLFTHKPKISYSSNESLEKKIEYQIKNKNSIDKNIKKKIDKEHKHDETIMGRAAHKAQQWREEFRRNLLNKRPKNLKNNKK